MPASEVDRLVLEATGDIWANSQIVRNVTAFRDECGNRLAGTESE